MARCTACPGYHYEAPGGLVVRHQPTLQRAVTRDEIMDIREAHEVCRGSGQPPLREAVSEEEAL